VCCGVFAVWKIARFIAKVSKTFLFVKGHRIIYFSTDVIFCKERSQFISIVWNRDDILIIDIDTVGCIVHIMNSFFALSPEKTDPLVIPVL